ncbi:hypothetical protein H0H93_015187 [Arthromyces matolae]|nr:hypothetical protein H0H93_015187 [Arthromyces matolae]
MELPRCRKPPKLIPLHIIGAALDDFKKTTRRNLHGSSKWLHLQRPCKLLTATAVAHAKEGRGLIRINGSPINLVQPEILRLKVYEPILVASEEAFRVLDIRVRVKGGGHTSQVYAIRQAIAKAVVAYYAKYIDAHSALELKKRLVAYDRTLLIADPRRMEPKKFGGAGARARRQKRFRLFRTLIKVGVGLLWTIRFPLNPSKVLKSLKKGAYGATICSDPKQASVILVDATSDEGRGFIREWGADTDKVVLQHTWAKACIQASRFIGKDDGWGGFLAVDDGLPIVKESLDDPIPVKNLLPTPRITPTEASVAGPIQSSLPVPDLPFAAQSSFQNNILHGPLSAYSPSPSIPNQQMYQQQAFMMHHPSYLAHMQQQAFAQSNAMFQQHTTSNGPSSMGGPFGNFDIYQMNFNPFYNNANRHMVFSTQSPSDGLHTPTSNDLDFSGIPPSLRRKSPVLSRSTPTYTPSDHFKPTSSMASSESIAPLHATPSCPTPGMSNTGTLFRSKNGRELSFFVQVDLNNRSRTVTAIKKHGGKIVSNNKTADYAVLYSQSKTFEQLLESTLLGGRPAVTATFVHDCIDQNKLLATTSYEFEARRSKSATPSGKRKRVKDEEDDSSDENLVAKHEKKKERAKAKDDRSAVRKRQSGKPRVSHQLQAAESVDPSRPRSPTPPPEHTRVKHGVNYLYSEQERHYAERYVEILLQRDHLISGSAIGKALWQKASCLMDNHSLNSWRTFLTLEPFRSKLENWRKLAGIQFRKKQREKQLAEEIETVAQFFATGAGRTNQDEDDGNDAVAWERLSQQVCGRRYPFSAV